MNSNAIPSASVRPTPFTSSSAEQFRQGTLARDIAEIRDVYEGPATTTPQTRGAKARQSQDGCFNALFIKICERLFGRSAH